MTTIKNTVRTNGALSSWTEDGEEFTVTLNASNKPASIQSKRGRWVEQSCTINYDSAGNFIGLSGALKTLMLPDIIADANGTVRTVTSTSGVAELVAPGADLGMTLVLSQGGIPISIPPSGSVGDNGALTLGTATPITYSAGIYLYFASGKVYPVSPAGFYWTVMSSTTAGVVYNNIYSPNTTFPIAPTSPTPIVATGPGAFTGVQTEITALYMTVPGGLMGKNGRINFNFLGAHNNTAGNKTYSMYVGGTLMSALTATSSVSMVVPKVTVTNRGVENRQVAANSIVSGTGSAAPSAATINTAADFVVEVRLTHSSSATDLIGIESHRITVEPRSV